MEPGEQLAAVDPQRPGRIARVYRSIEFGHITPESPVIQTNHTITTGYHHAGPQSLAQDVEGLAEGRPSVLMVEIGPEKGNNRISRVKTCGRGCSKVSQQREPFRLCHYGAKLIAFRTTKINRAQQRQPNHYNCSHASVVYGIQRWAE
jgi:hypothetical protein